jgi:hypothetical protein
LVSKAFHNGLHARVELADAAQVSKLLFLSVAIILRLQPSEFRVQLRDLLHQRLPRSLEAADLLLHGPHITIAPRQHLLIIPFPELSRLLGEVANMGYRRTRSLSDFIGGQSPTSR